MTNTLIKSRYKNKDKKFLPKPTVKDKIILLLYPKIYKYFKDKFL